jgi:predicted RNase H-like HicB family nuclease
MTAGWPRCRRIQRRRLRAQYAVLLYQQGDSWCAAVPDLDYDGEFAPTRAEVLAMMKDLIQNMRASYRDQGQEHQPEHQCVMLEIAPDASAVPWEEVTA